MFEKFSDRAINVILLAQEEARRTGFCEVGSEQILVGLIAYQYTKVVRDVISAAGLNLEDTRVEIEKFKGKGTNWSIVEFPFSPNAQKILKDAFAEIVSSRAKQIGIEHLWLSILAQEDCVATQVLRNMGVSFAHFRSEFLGAISLDLAWKAEAARLIKIVPAEDLPSGNLVDSDPELFSKFGNDAIKAVKFAQEESKRLGHNFVGSEQILLGILNVGSAAQVALKSFDVSLNSARSEVEKIIGRGSGHVAIEIPYTPRAYRIFEKAQRLLDELEHETVGPEHLLLALITEEEGVAVTVLMNLGIEREALRQTVFYRMLYGMKPYVEDGSGISQENVGKHTKGARVIDYAQEEARRLGHNWVGTEQILLGIIRAEGKLGKVFERYEITLDWAREAVERNIGRGSGFVAVEIPFTPRAKRVLELSWDEARQLGHNYIGIEHLMLGLIREGGGVGRQVLSEQVDDLLKFRRAVIASLENEK